MKLIEGEKHMIKVPYNQLLSMQTSQAVQKLANAPFKSPKQAYMVKFITKSIREGYFKAKKELDDLNEKYKASNDAPAEGTEAQKLGLPFALKEGINAEEAKKAYDGFGERVCQIQKNKIKPDELFEVGEWTPRELEALEFLVDEEA